MPDAGRTDPFTDVISLAAGPIAAVIRSFDQLRKGVDELMRGLENFNTTMENLNETATRINRLLNDFEAPVRAMIPQMTRTVKLADEIGSRLSGPLDQVIPGLNRLADVLDAPVFGSLPRDLGQFVDAINEVTRRMSPLAQIAEQAGGLFGLRIPGLSPRAPAMAPATEMAPEPAPPRPPVAAAARRKKSAATKKKQAPAKKRAQVTKKKAAATRR